MQIQVETLAPCRKKVHLVVPAERVKQEVAESFRQASAHLRLPGFRPGKIPRAVVEKRFGTSIRRDVKESLVNDGYQQALRENGIVPITSPEVDLDSVALDETQGLTIDFEFDARPEIDPKGYDEIEVTESEVRVEDAEVAEQVEEIRRSRSRPTKSEKGPLGKDGFAIAALEFHVDGASVLRRESVRLRSGMHVLGTEAAEFEEKLLGKRPGESFELAVTFPKEFEVKDVVGKKGTAKVEVREVYDLTAPADAELLKDLDVPDLDTLRKEVGRRIEATKAQAERRRVEDDVIDRVLEKNSFEIPDRIVDEQLSQRAKRYRDHLRNATDATPEEIETQVAAESSQSREDFAKSMKRLFLLDAIAKKERVFVTEDEIAAEIRAIAERNQTPPEEVHRYYRENGLLPSLRMELQETKVRSFLYGKAKRTPGASK